MTDPHKVTASKLMPQSPSSIEKFETCPRQYAHSYIIKDIPYRESPAQKEGNQFHEMAHLRLSLGAQTPKQYAQYEPLFERVAAWPALDTEVK